ncbi:hypothetical protein DFR86_00865 [Acidianus sulfidivorans JP7]|uniref:DUF3211 domain-containing protein n=1 Tax=Acidianus sulfidivorans JP7 TaxID=619593 RepID=A0A2U9IJU7_9CREN|nr:hypothetical protein [Acidianus sulfidivorans]AWR96236.1 hypothetical protein DFR86_00865 [Acidianus sulfidivorans JP7]
MIVERLEFNPIIYKIIKKPEIFIPLTYHFHIFEKINENQYVAFLYTREDVKNVKVEEYLQKFVLNFTVSPNEINYILDNEKGTKYTISINTTKQHIHITINSEKKKSIDETHLLDHILENLKYLEE